MKKSSESTSRIRNFILSNLERHPKDITSFTAIKFSISKQAVRKHISALVVEEKIQISGTTKDRVYKLALMDDFKITIPLSKKVSEDEIWREKIRSHFDGLHSNIISICDYGFTEMVNNVIDHSEGENLSIEFRRTAASIEMHISDDGIGIFEKISKLLELSDKIDVILELAKGKLTTDPKRHTGEGIFFTSRAFDSFMIISSNLTFAHIQSKDDWLLEMQDEIIHGTLVILQIYTDSNRKLKDVFNKYTDTSEYGFTKTHIPVNLARYGDENLLSRSQAKRLLSRFEKFKEIILDFSGVEIIGQAFADEIFRVFSNEHPEVHLEFIRANKNVRNMIQHAVGNKENIT